MPADFHLATNPFPTASPSKSKQMFEQMFHISPRFSAKLIVHALFCIPLCLCAAFLWNGAFVLCLSFFRFASLLLSAFALNLFSAFSVSRWFNFSHLQRRFAFSPQRQIAPVYPPLLRQYGGASRASRRARVALRFSAWQRAPCFPPAYSAAIWRISRRCARPCRQCHSVVVSATTPTTTTCALILSGEYFLRNN
jgi:hypothetical protein